MTETHDEKLIPQRIKGTVVCWFNYSVSFRNWENTLFNVTGGIKDRSYIAALPRTVASRAVCLVLVGGGNFLRLALHNYLNDHTDPHSWCLHFVCLDGRFQDEYRDILLSQDHFLGHTSWRSVYIGIPLHAGSLAQEHVIG
jgi:hypothetical protein